MQAYWIQMTATKNPQNWAVCSNLGLMDSDGVDPLEALARLNTMAAEYTAMGYTVTWDKEPLTADELAFYGDLFQASQWEEEQRIYAEFG